MIEESYVSFETARLLKEAGFREHSRCMYYEEKDGSYKLYKCLIGDYDVSTDKSYDGNLYGERYLAPTLALAARWLREVHGIHVSSNIFMDSANDADGNTVDEWTFWSFDLFDDSGRIIEESDDRYDSYEEALEAGLKYGLKLIKK